MPNLIIVDRKRKRKNFDTNWTDPFSLNEIHKEKARTIDVPNNSQNPIHKFIRKWGSHKLLLGRKVYCITDRKEMLSGHIVDIIPPYYLSLKNKGIVKFEDVIALGE